MMNTDKTDSATDPHDTRPAADIAAHAVSATPATSATMAAAAAIRAADVGAADASASVQLPDTTGAITLTPAQRSELRAAAHGLAPVVSISQKGLTETVLTEIERNLRAHGLIKIRVFETEREQREVLLTSICHTLGAAPVQHIGKLLVIWREKPAAQAGHPAPVRSRRKPPRLTKKAAAAKTDKAARARPVEKGKPRRPTRTR